MNPPLALRTLLRWFFLLVGGTTWLAAAEPSPVALHWLEQKPSGPATGVSWGVPWPRGQLARGDIPRLTVKAGDKATPTQSWPMAYWPDGSIKWTGHALVAGADVAPQLTLALGSAAPAAGANLATESHAEILVDTGRIRAKLTRSGNNFITALTIDGRDVATGGRLVSVREDRSEAGVLREIRGTSRVEEMTLEQNGPVRAVVKITGRHVEEKVGRAWLPFTLRLYFYAGADTVRMVHSFVFDGDQDRDFIRGLGVAFDVPFREEVHNRHVRLGGDAAAGLFAEPVRLITGREPPEDAALLGRQIAGERMPALADLRMREVTAQMPRWADFKLLQTSADAFAIQKRTSDRAAWIPALGGDRARGVAFVGDTSGGVALAVRHFWQLHPGALEISGAAGNAAQLTAWLWSPDAPAMDMRHYDTEGHSQRATYEDYEEGSATATGVARTHELALGVYAQVPAHTAVLALADQAESPARLIATPEYYYSVRTFGDWSLVDRSTPARRHLEDQLDRMFAFYHGQVEERRWYGFWDFGDVMHTYDHVRRVWKYDVGGYAWMNSEELPDLWLWYAFLRSGRADIFNMAEAMTRHTQEVDVYHLGKFAGLGSRHNVRHWGDGAKEARISQATLKRFYYYLTTDERTGDLMREVLNTVEPSVVRLDPLRKILPKTEYPTHLRSGPDWLALASNWMTEWERTGDTRWRDRIVTGMRSLAAMPGGLREILSFGYDPATATLHDVKDKQKSGQFIMIFGGAETGFELATLIDEPGWNKAWLELCEAWAKSGAGDMAGPRAAGFAARAKNDPALGARTWELMHKPGDGTGWERFPAQPTAVNEPGSPIAGIEYPGDMATGHLTQWALNIIVGLELAGKWLPPEPATK